MCSLFCWGSSIFCGLLASKLLSGLAHDVLVFRKRYALKGICRNYWNENIKLCFVFVIFVYIMISNGLKLTRVAAFFVGVMSYILKKLFCKHTYAEISQAIEDNRTNIGKASAYTYLYNYLDKVLPGIKRRIESFKLNHESNTSPIPTDAIPTNDHDIIISNKLYVLIPKSGNSPQYETLCKADSDVEYVDDLNSIEMDKDGHKNRQFHNSVYRIKDNKGSYLHFVGEFATPLTAIYKMQNKYKTNQTMDQIQIFYQTLNDCLKQRRVVHGNVCHLVYYDDDPACHPHPISKIMRTILVDEWLKTTI